MGGGKERVMANQQSEEDDTSAPHVSSHAKVGAQLEHLWGNVGQGTMGVLQQSSLRQNGHIINISQLQNRPEKGNVSCLRIIIMHTTAIFSQEGRRVRVRGEGGEGLVINGGGTKGSAADREGGWEGAWPGERVAIREGKREGGRKGEREEEREGER